MRKILLVEDDPDQALLSQACLEDAFDNIEVTVCETGSEALEQDIASFDALILDFNLPDITGLDLLRKISGKEHGPVIMITGEEVLEIAVQSLKEGAEEFVLKSVDLHQILPQIVERTIANFNWRKSLEAMQRKEQEKKVQIETLKRVMVTLAHHLNNGIMPIIFSAELVQRSDYARDKSERMVRTCLKETKKITAILERFEKYIEEEEFKYMDYLDLKDALFDVQNEEEPA
jgi:CheY-like chemotaxis protein